MYTLTNKVGVDVMDWCCDIPDDTLLAHSLRVKMYLRGRNMPGCSLAGRIAKEVEGHLGKSDWGKEVLGSLRQLDLTLGSFPAKENTVNGPRDEYADAVSKACSSAREFMVEKTSSQTSGANVALQTV